ncbi:hypothetical protein FHT40_004063 [Mycolicibacterium sp. BK556]|uniref:MmpS family transport accessory protein n=1 Tax=unclassified Mycolicibacterium TaxID=2636767 RepID=UPI0016187993|nr:MULTISPECIES: MmpS family transport accessory protein [unclassified Mycolicibacterium]MBB3604385.1 hypothetical protein [Mycolicibacterium sp. BK556]MBB3634902.1 hypothetical protein [Mycolicibacterium sp. BK607]
MLKRIGRVWLQLLVVMALALGGFAVFRLHSVFGSDDETTREGSGILNDAVPFNPKRVTYEVFGAEGTVATINYLDLSANPQSVKRVPLPWSVTLTTTAASASPNLMAQGTGDSIGCRISVDGVVKDEKSSAGIDAFTYCIVKSA